MHFSLCSLKASDLLQCYHKKRQMFKEMCKCCHTQRPFTIALLCSWKWFRSVPSLSLFELKRILLSHPSLSFLLKKLWLHCLGKLYLFIYFLSITNYVFVKIGSFSTFVCLTFTQTSVLQWEVLFQDSSLSSFRTKITWTVSPPWKKKKTFNYVLVSPGFC